MRLQERIDNDLKKAMKDKDRLKLSALRMLKAGIESLAIERKRGELKDEDILKLVRTQIRKHTDSIEQFTKGGRAELAEKEKAEMKMLAPYMPEELSEEDLKTMVTEAISEAQAASKADMGKVMKLVMAKVKGRADGKKVSQMVSSLLK